MASEWEVVFVFGGVWSSSTCSAVFVNLMKPLAPEEEYGSSVEIVDYHVTAT